MTGSGQRGDARGSSNAHSCPADSCLTEQPLFQCLGRLGTHLGKLCGIVHHQRFLLLLGLRGLIVRRRRRRARGAGRWRNATRHGKGNLVAPLPRGYKGVVVLEEERVRGLARQVWDRPESHKDEARREARERDELKEKVCGSPLRRPRASPRRPVPGHDGSKHQPSPS